MARKVVGRGHVNRAEQPASGLQAPEGTVVATGPAGSGETPESTGTGGSSGSGSSSSNAPFPLPLDGEDGQDGEQGPPGPAGRTGAPGAPGMDGEDADEETPILAPAAADTGLAPYVPVVDQATTPYTLVDGTVVGLFRTFERRTTYRIEFTVGAGDTFGTGRLTFTLPSVPRLLGPSTAFVEQATTFVAFARNEGSGVISLLDATGNEVDENSGGAMAAGDVVVITGVYEE